MQTTDPQYPTFNLAIPDDAWEETGPKEDPAARLHISCLRLSIAGMSMHLEAFAVREDEKKGYVSDVPAESEFDLNDEIEAVYTLRGWDPPDLKEIRGREYVLVAYPTG